MFAQSRNMISGGTFNSTVINQTTSRGMDILMEWVATGAFYNSKELYDAPKCHPNTRVAVLDDIMQWVNESESTREDFILWFFGPAGSGKSAIAKRIAEIAAEMDMLIGTFFFSRTSPTRNTEDRLIATLAYQLAISIPETRYYIEDAIERDRFIFNKDIPTQIDTLLIRPLQSTQITPSKKLIIIDGLDECNDRNAQLAILEAISRSLPRRQLPIIFLIASRPETDLVTSFNYNKPLTSIHRRLALDDTYWPDDDIRLFFSDKFKHIRRTHPLRSTIPISWPTQELLDRLVKKSSGQFIYASTVVKFVESSCHRPTARLNIILGVSPPGNTNPFAELDAVYNHLLSSVDDIQLTLYVLSFYVMTPKFAYRLSTFPYTVPFFLSLEWGDIQLALVNLSSIVTYHGEVEVLHASFVDFLSDKRRSTIYYIDKADTHTEFVHRILQRFKVPDEIVDNNFTLLEAVNSLSPCILNTQLRNDILNFDLDAAYNAWRRILYSYSLESSGYRRSIFWTWEEFLNDVGLEDRDKKEALDRLDKSLESRLQVYQSDWRLQLLVPLAFVNDTYPTYYRVLTCRCLDILLGLHDHDLHLADQNAFDLRHVDTQPRLFDVISHYLDHDTYASAALHCMRFLSNPPNYYKKNECPEMGLIYAEWNMTCALTLHVLPVLLDQSSTRPELVQFITDHDIHPAIQKDPTHPILAGNRIWDLNVHILSFLSRANVCSNWRIISAVQRSLNIAHNPRREGWGMIVDGQSILEENDANFDEGDNDVLMRQRLDQCCSDAHWPHPDFKYNQARNCYV